MSETEYSRLAEKLDELTKVVYKMDERLKDLPELTAKVSRHEAEIMLSKQRCDNVQEEKKKTGVPWGNVKGSLIVGIVVGIVMLGVNIFVTNMIIGGMVK